MNMTILEIFIQVGEERSFSAAARKLFITPSAVIQQMQKLERALGFTLFERNYNGVELTEEGRTLYKGAKDILRLWDSTLSMCADCAQRRENTLNIGVHTTSLMSAYKTFVANHPHIVCNYIIYTEQDVDRLYSDFIQDKLHIIEWPMLQKLRAQGITFLPRYEAEICCVMREGHPLCARSELTPDDLMGEQLLLYTHKHQEVIEEAFCNAMRQGIIPMMPYSLIEGDTNKVIDACAQGGLILVSWAYAKQLPLRVAPLRPSLHVNFGLAYKQKSSLAVKEMIDFIAAYDRENGVAY